MKRLAILIPGIMGSELRVGPRVVWPGPVTSMFGPYRDMAALTSGEIEPYDIIRQVSISRLYVSLVEDLHRCGFREIDTPSTLFACPYDWRQDNARSAAVLARCIAQAVALHASEGVDVTLVAHSMGGLVARYYLESGEFNASPGFSAVRRLITLGTPHRGAPLALAAALGQQGRLFLSAAQVHRLASDPRYPALYQMLPPRGEPFLWNDREGSALGPVDIYDDSVAQGLGLSLENLAAASRFHEKLRLDARPPDVRYFCFAGTHQRTLSNVSVRDASLHTLQRFEADYAGDGTVPSWSAMPTGVQGMLVGGEHSTLFRCDDLRRTLAVLVNREGVLEGDEAGVEVAVRDRVVVPEAPVRLTLRFPGTAFSVEGELRLERVDIDRPDASPVARETHNIRYVGVAAETLNVRLKAPLLSGLYRVAFYAGQADTCLGADELIVQRGS